MHQQIKNNAHCRSGILFFGHLKRAISEDRASRMRVERTGEHSEEEEREGVVARRSGGGSRRRGTLLGLCWIFSTRHLFIPVSSPGL